MGLSSLGTQAASAKVKITNTATITNNLEFLLLIVLTPRILFVQPILRRGQFLYRASLHRYTFKVFTTCFTEVIPRLPLVLQLFSS